MSLVGIDFRFPDALNLFKGREEEILMFVAAQLQTNRGEMFDTENAGRTPWPKPKLRDGMPLSHTGALRKSFAPMNDGRTPVVAPDGIVRFTGETVTIGTKLAYAQVHNTGKVIRPKNHPVLWIPLPDGSRRSSNAPTKYAKDIKKAAQNRARLPKLRDQMARAHRRYMKTGDAGDLEKAVELKAKVHELSKHTDGPPVVQGRNGKWYMLAKQVTIPKRPMDEWSAADQNELETALAGKLEEVLTEIFNG